MYCDNCGAENRDEANFCHNCSQKFSHIPMGEKPSAVAATASVSPPLRVSESTTQEQFSRILGGRYELKEMLGRGGMGVVYRGHDRQLGMDVAIKFLLESFLDDFVAIESLKHEAKAAMRLSHPNILRLHNFEDTSDAKYLLMEFVQGESLAAIAARKADRRFTEQEVINYASNVCEALKYAHAENVVHRDIKPSNILIASTNQVKLADFGVAHLKTSSMNSELGGGGGTPIYMSPEQILGQDIDGRCDLYSLGVTMYEMLAGKPPFRGPDVSYHHVHVQPKPIDGVTEWMNAVVLKCLRKDADSRWQTAGELQDVLMRKKDIGIAFQAKYQPWWRQNEAEERKVLQETPLPQEVSATSEPQEESEGYVVYRTPLPRTSSAVRERVKRIEHQAGLKESLPEREHARMGFGALAGLLGGAILVFIAGHPRLSVTPHFLFGLSWLVYGGLIGLSVGLAQKRTVKGILSFTLGVLGGMVAAFMVRSMQEIAAMDGIRPAAYAVLCAATVGAVLGVADGIYERSIKYALHCVIWAALGGAMAMALFLVVRHVFSAFWLPVLNWYLIGIAFGFFVNLFVGLAEKPWIAKQASL